MTDDPMKHTIPPMWPLPSVYERRLKEAADFWRGEAIWWRHFALSGWCFGAGSLLVTLWPLVVRLWRGVGL